MKIILFRHGEKQKYQFNGNKNYVVSLTPKGISQVKKLADILKIRFPELINSRTLFSSPFPRTVQGAEIVRSVLNIGELLIYEEFREFFTVINYDGSKEQRKKFVFAMQNHNWIPPKTGISFKKAILNFQDRLKEIYIENKDKTILVSTHGGIIRNMIYDLEPKLRPNDKDISAAFIQEAGYTTLNYDGKDFKLEQFDVHDYLD